jgi:hypothetical protein
MQAGTVLCTEAKVTSVHANVENIHHDITGIRGVVDDVQASVFNVSSCEIEMLSFDSRPTNQVSRMKVNASIALPDELTNTR